MSKAAKCDKCDVLFDFDGAHFSTEGWGVGWKPGAGWFPEPMDLCKACAEAFGKAVAAWWEGETFAPKEAVGAVLQSADLLVSECRRVTPELYEQEIVGYETMRAALLAMLL